MIPSPRDSSQTDFPWPLPGPLPPIAGAPRPG